MRLHRPVLATLLLGAALPATAAADTLLAAAPGASNLSEGSGWMAWARPAGERSFRIAVRAPDGTVSDAAIGSFAGRPDPAIGTTWYRAGRRIVVVYPRCRGASTRVGCDLYEYDVAARSERRLSRVSSRAASEVAPSFSSGILGFARLGGPRPGTYTAAKLVRRIDGRPARETAVSGSRIAFLVRTTDGRDEITMTQLDGARRRVARRAARGTLSSPVITRYRLGWLEHRDGDVVARMSPRINPSDTTIEARTSRPLGPTVNSAASDDSSIKYFADGEGIKRAVPDLFPF